jgi:hypothetical protein
LWYYRYQKANSSCSTHDWEFLQSLCDPTFKEENPLELFIKR